MSFGTLLRTMLDEYKGMIAFFDTCIRNLELCSIKYEDIKSNAILIRSKGSKQRFVPITHNLAKIMLKF